MCTTLLQRPCWCVYKRRQVWTKTWNKCGLEMLVIPSHHRYHHDHHEMGGYDRDKNGVEVTV